MKHTPILCVVCTLALAACGDDGDGARTSYLDPQPIAMSAEVRGILGHYTGSLSAVASKLDADVEAAANFVLHEQVYSEFEHARVGSQPRATEPRFDVRVGAAYADPALGPRLDTFSDLYWVVDFQRVDRGWLVDWNGLERDDPDVRQTAFTFSARAAEHDSDYQEAVLERVVTAFEGADPRPGSVIIGSEMDRHWLAAPDDWPAFARFVRDLSAALREVDGSVRIGVGINWSHFMDEVVPSFVGASAQTEVNFAAVRAAWEGVIDPLYIRNEVPLELALDFYAFSAIPDAIRYASPSDLPEDHFSGPATYFDEYPGKELPVAWFAVGWPVDSPSSQFFGDFWRFFVSHAGGVDVELAAWWGYGHLLSDSDCATMTQRVGAARSACYRGLYTSSGSDVAGLRDAFFTDGTSP